MLDRNTPRLLVNIILVPLACVLVGCPGKPAPAPSSKGNDANGSASANTLKSACRDNLDNILSSIDPERLEISADIESTVSVMNDWLGGCGESQPYDQDILDRMKPLFSESAFDHLTRERYTRRDINHVRTAILLSKISESVTEGATSDLERVVALFHFVRRNVVRSLDSQQVPLTVYEILLFGRGSPEQQAWVFAELVRQLRLDSFILTGQNSPADERVFAVMIDGAAYLFDFSLGTPVPSSLDKLGLHTNTPATLSNVLIDPGPIDLLRSQGSTIPDVRALSDPKVTLILESSHAAKRMESLDAELAGQRAMIHQSLVGDEETPGLLERIASAGGDRWSESDVAIWSFPEQQTEKFWSVVPDSQESQQILGRKLPFSAPAEIEHNSQLNQYQLGLPSKRQWSTRVAQLEGLSADAIRSYGAIRLSANNLHKKFPGAVDQPGFAMIMQMHEVAAEDAHFWVGVAQLTDGDESAARSTLENYLRRFPSGRWSDAARLFRADLAIEREDYDSAREELSGISEISALKPAVEYTRSRLNALSPEPEGTAEEKDQSETP